MVTFCSAACPIVLMYRAPYTVQAGVTFFLVHFGISFGLVYKNNYSEIPFPLEALHAYQASDFDLSPIVSINIGVSAPLILKSFANLIPGEKPSSVN